ncbi:MAG: hypothetical protein Q4G03_07455 [Planctomycetia bacterium]|nr:hypothetical protein [Planctomycetia bacterium]
MTNNENKNRRDLFVKIAAEYDRKIADARALAETAARRLSQEVAAEAEDLPTAKVKSLGACLKAYGRDTWRSNKDAGEWAIRAAVNTLWHDMAAVLDDLYCCESIDRLPNFSRGCFNCACAVLWAFWKWDPLRISFDRALGAFIDAVDLLENREKRILEQVDAQERAEESEDLYYIY